MLYKSDKLRDLKLLRYYNICGEGVYKFMNGDLQIKLNPKLLLQPYWMDKNVQENVKWTCFILEKR